MAAKKPANNPRAKRKMTAQQEFEIMKLVLDKFLWLGVGLLAIAFWQLFTGNVDNGIYLIVVAAVVLVLFIMIIMREFEVSSPQK